MGTARASGLTLPLHAPTPRLDVGSGQLHPGRAPLCGPGSGLQAPSAFDPEPRSLGLCTGPVFGAHTPLLPPSLLPWGSSFCCCCQGVICTPASSPRAIRRARPRRRPQISWIYPAPHAAGPPSLPAFPGPAPPSPPSQRPSQTKHDCEERAEWPQPQEATRR